MLLRFQKPLYGFKYGFALSAGIGTLWAARVTGQDLTSRMNSTPCFSVYVLDLPAVLLPVTLGSGNTT